MSPGDLFLGDGTSVRGTLFQLRRLTARTGGPSLSTMHSMGHTEDHITNHLLENAVKIPQFVFK